VSKRLLATYVTLTIVVLAALEIPLGIQYGRSERRDLTNRIARDALTMATFAEDPLERGIRKAPVGLVRAARDYQQSPGGRVVVVDKNGLSIVDTQEPIGRNLRTATRLEIAKALHGNVASGIRHSNTLGTDLIYVAVPVASAGHIRGAVRITYPTSALDSRVTRYWLLLAAIGGVVLAAATVVGLRFARTLTRPLSALEQAAATVGEGDLTARAPADTGPPEVRAVAARFNETVERLDGLLHSQQEFVADASHQLRTPLTALRLRLENLERDVPPDARRDLEAALTEVERLARLVDGLLVLARADAATPATEPVDLATLTRARIDHWSLQAAERGVELVADIPPRLQALVTPGALEQVLDNLLANALAVSPPGSTVWARGSDAGETVELRVSDEGPGMSTEQRARAFDRFWRAGPPGTGTGLGLAVVHRLVTADGGQVELREARGGGLEAVITLRASSRIVPNPYAPLARA
jgi:signal transduction histidine kinase